MRYYVLRVKYQKDGTEKRSETMAYDDAISAEAKFHSNLATDMADDTLAGSLCSVVNEYGNLEWTRRWNVPDEPTPPEPEEQGNES